jgi:hypothetical protein
MIFLTGQGDRGNLRAFNGGADGTRISVISKKDGFAGILTISFFVRE